MLIHKRTTMIAFCMLSLSAAGLAQQVIPGQAAKSDSHIQLDVVVAAGSGAPIAGLQQQDFTVLDNKTPRPITSFSAVTGAEAPVEVILLVDAVNARYETVAYEKDRIDKFLLTDGGELPHPVSLAVLTDKGTQIEQGSSRDGKALKAALDQYAISLRTITRSTGFYGAEDRLNLSLKALDGLITREETKPGRKMIFWVSPGWPLISGPGVQLDDKQERQIFRQVVGLSARLRKARITLYSINPLGTEQSLVRADYYKSFVDGVSKPSQVSLGDLGLQVLATQTGGLALTTNNDIPSMLQRAMNDSKAYYEITFEAAPGDQPDQYHRIDVQVDKAGVAARTRTGYYAQP